MLFTLQPFLFIYLYGVDMYIDEGEAIWVEMWHVGANQGLGPKLLWWLLHSLPHVLAAKEPHLFHLRMSLLKK